MNSGALVTVINDNTLLIQSLIFSNYFYKVL